MAFRVGDIVRLKGECGMRPFKTSIPPDSTMKGCWHGGGPVRKVFQDGSYLIADKQPWKKNRLEGVYVRRALGHDIEVVG